MILCSPYFFWPTLKKIKELFLSNACNKNHANTDNIVKDLPIGKEGVGRHKCASYAYEICYEYELQKAENINLENVLSNLEKSQKGDRIHRSLHAAYSFGYYNGVVSSY